MKNQYFGNNRDLFKYDLIYHILQAGMVDHFVFIPMLTRDDHSQHGRGTNREAAKAGTKNRILMEFLDKCLREGEKDIKQIESFFHNAGISITIWGDDKYFSHERRNDYFEQACKNLLPKSLVFVDPDVGLEVKRTTEKHIQYSEVRKLYERMGVGSILMIYQHFPRQDHLCYLNMRMEEIKNKVAGDWPICIDDNEIIFFLLPKGESLEQSLIEVIKDYDELYSN